MSPSPDERAASTSEAARSGAPAPASAPEAAASGPSARVREMLREMRRFARGVLGSDAYDKYVHHHRIMGCEHPLLSEKEFWRAKYREQDENPGARCC